MVKAFTNYKPNAATELWEKFNLILYFCGLKGFWVEPVYLPEKFMKIYSPISFIAHILSITFSISLLLSFIFQKDLSAKQKADQSVCNLANSFSNFYCLVFLYHRRKCRDVLYTLFVSLKQEHNDLTAEKQMITKLKIYILAYVFSGIMTLIFYGLFGLSSVMSGGSFVTIIPAWPHTTDASTTAEVARVIIYWFWWISFLRISSCYLFPLSFLIGISHQYRNLQSYFYSLNSIFEEDASQDEKERKYEKAFIRGVRMHYQTLWCKNETQHVCRVVFDAQMLLSTVAFMSLLPIILVNFKKIGFQVRFEEAPFVYYSEITGLSKLSIILAAFYSNTFEFSAFQYVSVSKDSESGGATTKLRCVPLVLICLVATGYFMWNAGDVSVEAARLPEAMFGSGWQHCRGPASARVRKLLVIAMEQAQQPVVLKALGCIELSHETYLAIIKTSHSIFSVFY